MTAPDHTLIDEILSGQIDLLRYTAGTRAKVLSILTRLQTELTANLRAGSITEFNKARLTSMLKQATDTIDAYYASAQGALDTAMGNAADVAAASTSAAMETSLGIVLSTGLPTETFLSRIASNALVQGAPSADWWAKQSSDTAFRFANEVRQGMAAGETNDQIVARITGSPKKGISGVMDIARANASALVHTSIQAAANASRMETYRRNDTDFEKVQWLATLDSHTCEICGSRDLKYYSLDDNPTPIGHDLSWKGGPGVIHWSCRCVAVGVPKDIELPGGIVMKMPVGQRASEDGPVKGNTSFQQFLDRKGAAWQDENLGSGRGALYRKGSLTIEQLLSLNGTRINSVEQLKARYAK